MTSEATPADTYLFRTEIREVQPLSLVRHVSGRRDERRDEHTYEMSRIYDATLAEHGVDTAITAVVNDFSSDPDRVNLLPELCDPRESKPRLIL